MTNIYAEVYKCPGTRVINLDLIMEEEKKASSLLLFLLSLGRDPQVHLAVPFHRLQADQGICESISQIPCTAARRRGGDPRVYLGLLLPPDGAGLEPVLFR